MNIKPKYKIGDVIITECREMPMQGVIKQANFEGVWWYAVSLDTGVQTRKELEIIEKL